MTCHFSDTKLDAREGWQTTGYEDTIVLDCECNADKTCEDCIDAGIYASDADQYNGGYIDAEQEAYYNGNP